MSDCECFICKQMDTYTETEYECPICFETICSEVNTVITECGHKFHCKCLMQNAMHNGFGCPYCRTDLIEKPVVNTNIIDYEDEDEDEDEENMELEEGEIIQSDFEEFIDRQHFHEEMNELNYSLTSFRMFQQYIEGEEVEQEDEEELRERLDMERKDRKYQRDSNSIIATITNDNNISKEDLVRALLYGSFQHEAQQEKYFKVYGKIKGTIISRRRYLREFIPIQMHA